MNRFVAALAAVLWFGTAWGQAYPDKPIKFVVPFAPGGNLDFIARTVQPKLSEYLGVPVVIDNKAGAGGIVGAAFAAQQPADGYTILLGNTGTNAIYPAIYDKLSYDPFKDFIPVARTTTNDFLAVINPGVPANNLKEFIAYAKANPGKMSAAVAGVGSSTHFAFELIKRNAGIDMLMVPYKGSAPAVNDVVGGHAQFIIDAPPVTLEFVKAGRLRPMAVTGKKRLASAPDVPAFDEAGLPGIEASGFQGIFVPAGTPPAIVSKLSDAILRVLAQPDVRERFASQGLDTSPLDAKDFAAFIKSEAPKWAGIAKAANIKAEQ
jgi:tripartite-type tricarboxylate transporter receptor subunit TctC